MSALPDSTTIDLRTERTARVSAYVDLALAEVIDAFTRPDIDEVLASVLITALDAPGVRVRMHATPPAWVTARSASASLTWEVIGTHGRVRRGTATVDLLTVQSGHHPMTELLVTVTVGDDVPAPLATTRRFLDELTGLLPLRV